MASTDSIIRLKVESKEYEQKLERAAKGLQHLGEYCQKAGKNISELDKETVDYVRAIGQMEAKNKSARGSLSEMTKSFTEMSVAYRKLTDEEKQTPFGQALAKSLDELKVRIQQDKQQLDDISKSLQTTTGESNKMTGMVDMLGQKLGVGGNLIEMLTSKTAMLTAGMTAAAAAVGKATQAWVAYNNELAKQDQITSVTTGLKGGDAEHMTDTMRSIADTYNVDFREAINAANTLMTQFGATGDEAIRLIKDGMQGMIQGDGPKLLSMIKQYAPSFRDAGVSASQLVAVIQNSEGGIFTDENMNAIAMGMRNIRLMTKKTGEALAQLGIDGGKMSKQLNDGSLTVFEALSQVAAKLEAVGSNSQTAGEVLQYVFGRQGSMAGTNLAKAIETLNTNLDETKRQTGEVGESLVRLQEANEKLNVAIRRCFEYDGWNQMTNDIKSGLIAALTDVIEDIGLVKNALSKLPKEIALISGPLGAVVTLMGDLGIKAENSFTAIRNGATLAMGPVGALFNMLKALGGKSFSQAVSDAAVGNFTIYDPGDHNSPTSTPHTTSSKNKNKGSHKATPQERAQSKVDAALLDYAQTITKADLRMQAGLDDSLAHKKKELSAQERLYDAYSDAYAVYANPAYKKAAEDAAEKIKGLSAEVKEQTDAQESAKKSARELDATQKKLNEALQEAANAYNSNDLKGYITAQKKVGGDITAGLSGDNFSYTSGNLNAFSNYLKEQIANADVGSDLFNKLTSQLADANTLGNILEISIKNGIDTANINPQELWNKIFSDNPGDYIDDSTWQEIVDEINEKLKSLGIEPIKLNLNTGELKKEGQETQKAWKGVASSISSVGSALQSLEDPGAKVAGIIANAIANIALAFSESSIKAAGGGPVAWIAATASGLATMISTIAAIKSATAGSYAEGGIIPGNNHNDGLLANVSSGELILNRSQQNSIAAQLQDGERRGGLTPSHISGEQIYIALNRYTKRTGRGELVTWK